MAESSPKYGLTRSGRGWYRRVGGRSRYIVAVSRCPTGVAADAWFEKHVAHIAKPAVATDSLGEAFNGFIANRRARKLNAGTISDYLDTGRKLVVLFGSRSIDRLTSADAEAFRATLEGLSPSRRQKHLVNVRAFLRWAGGHYAPSWTLADFPNVSKRELRLGRVRHPPFSPAQVRRLMRYGNTRQRLVVLLGLNMGVGPHEMSLLKAEDFKGGVFTLPRSKTGVERCVPIWPEVLALLPKKGRLFDATAPVLIRTFRRLCDRACVPPWGIYHLRRTFRTVADTAGDQRAAARVMGRELPDTDTVYVTQITVERIGRMLEHVRTALRVRQAMKARQLDAWVFSLERRMHHRKHTGRATPTKRRERTARLCPPSDREAAPPPPSP